MRRLWPLCILLVLACGPGGGPDADRALADLQDSAIAAFVTTRAERDLPEGPLQYRAGAIYSAAPAETANGLRVWQVRRPSADVIVLPLDARDKLAGIELKADVLVRYEERYCELADDAAPSRCQSWQEGTCCNRVWKRKRGEWLVEAPR